MRLAGSRLSVTENRGRIALHGELDDFRDARLVHDVRLARRLVEHRIEGERLGAECLIEARLSAGQRGLTVRQNVRTEHDLILSHHLDDRVIVSLDFTLIQRPNSIQQYKDYYLSRFHRLNNSTLKSSKFQSLKVLQ